MVGSRGSLPQASKQSRLRAARATGVASLRDGQPCTRAREIYGCVHPGGIFFHTCGCARITHARQGALWPTSGLRCTELRPTNVVAPGRPPALRCVLISRARLCSLYGRSGVCRGGGSKRLSACVHQQHGLLPATLRPSGSHRLGVDHAHLLFHSLCGTCQREREAVGQVRRQQGLLSAACQ